MEQHDDDDSMPGQDSFIDVVCNMVGILIDLVMIVGVRASRPAEFRLSFGRSNAAPYRHRRRGMQPFGKLGLAF